MRRRASRCFVRGHAPCALGALGVSRCVDRREFPRIDADTLRTPPGHPLDSLLRGAAGCDGLGIVAMPPLPPATGPSGVATGGEGVQGWGEAVQPQPSGIIGEVAVVDSGHPLGDEAQAPASSHKTAGGTWIGERTRPGPGAARARPRAPACRGSPEAEALVGIGASSMLTAPSSAGPSPPRPGRGGREGGHRRGRAGVHHDAPPAPHPAALPAVAPVAALAAACALLLAAVRCPGHGHPEGEEETIPEGKGRGEAEGKGAGEAEGAAPHASDPGARAPLRGREAGS